MTIETQTPAENGAVITVALDCLKASPRNARKTPHRLADIETLAASIAAKGLLQPLVVEPERDGEGRETGCYLVTIGEGRRQALRLLAKRKRIKKTAQVRCVVDVANNPHEISLDENLTRFAMHPADQFEAFQRLVDEQGFGPEEVAARFGVTPAVVKQRLRLAAVSPKLMSLYREDGMSLDQLMAFTITEDHDRQEAVWEGLSWNKEPALIRRMIVQDRVRATDRRAMFVGGEAYVAAGGIIERDLFSEDHGGYFTDPTLLDRLALEKLATLTDGVLADGWKWAAPVLELPPVYDLRRVYPRYGNLMPEDQTRYDGLYAEYQTLFDAHEGDDELDDAVEAQLKDLGRAIETLEAKRLSYEPEEQGRAGVFVVLGQDGAPRLEAGFVRPEDEPPPLVEESPVEPSADAAPSAPDRLEEDEVDSGEAALAPLSDKLVADLTAHRTAALIDRLGQEPSIALSALVHALAMQTFFHGRADASCLVVRTSEVHLPNYAEGIAETKAWSSVEARHAAWMAELPDSADRLWEAVCGMDLDKQLALLAYCVGRSVNAVRSFEVRGRALAHADQLAMALRLNMADYWTPTVTSYLGRVTKGRILEAVCEGVSPDASERIAGLKKQPMAETAEELLTGKRWIPSILRTEGQAESQPVLLAAE